MNIIRVGTTTVGNIILVTTDNGATVYATNGTKTISGIAVDGVAKLKAKAGIWRVWAELNGDTTSEVEVVVTDNYNMEMHFGNPISSLSEGALIRINENGSAANFYLSKHNYESGLNGNGYVLLVRSTLYNNYCWDIGNVNAYNGSDIDIMANETYLALLDEKLQKKIPTVKIHYTPGNGNRTVSVLERKGFILSQTELNYSASNYNAEGTALPIASTLRYGTLNGARADQWTRSPQINTTNIAWDAFGNGSQGGGDYCNAQHGFRPVFCVLNTMTINPDPNADGSYTLFV